MSSIDPNNAQALPARTVELDAARQPQGLLDSILESAGTPGAERPWIDGFLAEPSLAKSLAMWLGHRGSPAKLNKRELAGTLSRDLARLDQIIARQVSAIL